VLKRVFFIEQISVRRAAAIRQELSAGNMKESSETRKILAREGFQ
jgi:hypothetical protein